VVRDAVDVTVTLTWFAEQDAVIDTGGKEQGVQEPMELLDDSVAEQDELYIVVVGEQLVDEEHTVSGGQVEAVEGVQLWDAETVTGVHVDEQVLDTVTGRQLDPLTELDVCDGQVVGKIVVTELQ
jgi:hypothetical protein